jgi:pyruvate formate lyase activating enzyme
MEKRRPLIFDIKRHALEDGPGIRTTVFLKGCQLRCIWCQNPESIDPAPEIGFYPNSCIQSGECVTVCTASAIFMDNPWRIDWERCDKCGDCVKVCPGRGLRQIGLFYPVEELLSILLRDKAFYEVSGGGVTLSGGEPTLYMDYVSSLLKALKKEGIHTAMETNGLFNRSEFKEKLLPWLDLIMFDVKLADSKEHLRYTGRGNETILENLAKLIRERPDDVIPRTALIPRITATTKNLRTISQLYQSLGIERCVLLPYNSIGFTKAENIGKKVDPELSGHMMGVTEERKYREIFSWAELD